MITNQWIRKIGLFVVKKDRAIDLSQFRVRFKLSNADFESPNSAFIRVYNLDSTTMQSIKQEYSQVVLNAGYNTYQGASPNYGVIFQGSIIQFRSGRENATDTYLDILAADGDLGYNDGFFFKNYAAGTPYSQPMQDVANAMYQKNSNDPNAKNSDVTLRLSGIDPAHSPAIRGQVLMGLGRAHLRMTSRTFQHMWSIQDGQVKILPLSGPPAGTAQTPFEINTSTGMIGIPEQTVAGIEVRCLLNPIIRIGSFVKLNNGDINKLEQQNPNIALAYNRNPQFGLQNNTPLATQTDGVYMVFAAEHEGDTRGNEWHTDLICLAVEVNQQTVSSN